MDFNVSKAFGYGKDLLYKDLTVISASKDGNNIIFMDKNRSFYELLRDSISEATTSSRKNSTRQKSSTGTVTELILRGR